MPRPVHEFGGISSLTPGTPVRPELASLILDILAFSAQSEISIAHFFFSLCPDPDERLRLGDLFLKNGNRMSRKGAISALTTKMFSSDDAKIFDKILSKIDKAADKRDIFAHCRFGTVTDDPKVLAVITERKAIDFYANFSKRAPPPGPGINGDAIAYTTSELHDIIAEIKKATEYLGEFRVAIDSSKKSDRKAMETLNDKLDGKI